MRQITNHLSQRPSTTPDNVFGLCQKRGLLRGTVFHPDPMGKIISFGLLFLFLSVIVAVCLRWLTPGSLITFSILQTDQDVLHCLLLEKVLCLPVFCFNSVVLWAKGIHQWQKKFTKLSVLKPPPRLRVIPATGDAETANRSALSPSPPPAYMEIYPDTSDTTFTSININHLGPPAAREAENPSLLNPMTPLNDADVR